MPAKKTTKSTKSTAKKAASPKKRTASTKAKASKSTKSTKATDAEITIDRRRKADRRDDIKAEAAKSPMGERREKVQRRRQIDPTTCERDYSVVEVEFMNAMDEYKRTSGRMFPTCSEVLEVIQGLGYEKLTPAELAVFRPEAVESTEVSEESSVEGEEELSDELETVAVLC